MSKLPHRAKVVVAMVRDGLLEDGVGSLGHRQRQPDLGAERAREVDVLLLVLERELRAEGVGDHVGALALIRRAPGWWQHEG